MDKIEYYSKRSLLILEFIATRSESKAQYSTVRNIINEQTEKRNSRGLSMISRDLNAWAKGLSTSDQKLLNEKLLEMFGDDLTGDSQSVKEIRKILKKKKIDTIEEYSLIHQYTQDIAEDDNLFSKLPLLEKMLSEFDHGKERT